VAIEVSGMVARTRVSQHFHNPGSEHVEGVYVFPLPEKAAVDRLRIRIGDRAIEGRIREKGEARVAYLKAKAEGRKAALVEQLRPNLFTNTVAHIGPDERVEVTIEYQQVSASRTASTACASRWRCRRATCRWVIAPPKLGPGPSRRVPRPGR
jgi:Ca-activated chloride channel family protein